MDISARLAKSGGGTSRPLAGSWPFGPKAHERKVIGGVLKVRLRLPASIGLDFAALGHFPVDLVHEGPKGRFILPVFELFGRSPVQVSVQLALIAIDRVDKRWT